VNSVIHVKVCDLSPVNHKLHSRRRSETWKSEEGCAKAVGKAHFLTNHTPNETPTPKLSVEPSDHFHNPLFVHRCTMSHTYLCNDRQDLFCSL